VRVVLLVPLLMVALGCGNHRQVVDVSRIQVSPSPEGPTLIASHETSSGLLAQIAQTVPRTWPANPAQECQLGTTIEITVGRRTYRLRPMQLAVVDRAAPQDADQRLQAAPHKQTDADRISRRLESSAQRLVRRPHESLAPVPSSAGGDPPPPCRRADLQHHRARSEGVCTWRLLIEPSLSRWRGVQAPLVLPTPSFARCF
jgi:hypothetical protein